MRNRTAAELAQTFDCDSDFCGQRTPCRCYERALAVLTAFGAQERAAGRAESASICDATARRWAALGTNGLPEVALGEAARAISALTTKPERK